VADASARLEPMATVGKSVPELFVSNTIPSRLPDVWLTPTEVWEIKATQLTMSPSYTCGTELLAGSGSPDQQDAVGKRGKGLALRFPRFLRRRTDKSPRDATDSEQVVELFHQAAATPERPSDSS
jgi:DNA ligase-1